MMNYVGVLAEQQRPLRFLASRLLWHSRLCRLFRISKEGYTLRFYPSSLSANLWLNPDDREGEEAFLRAYLRPGDVMIDVGANIGDLTLAASTIVGETGRVYAIEAHPVIFGFLLGNIALNRGQNVQAFNVAMGASSGAVQFSNVRSDDQNAVITGESGIEVPVLPLDELPLGEGDLALLKVDVEGYEKFVFSGAAGTLSRVRCIYFESWERHYAKYGYRLRDLLLRLSDSGFKVFRQESARVLRVIDTEYRSERCENLFALRNPVEFAARTGYRVETTVAGSVSPVHRFTVFTPTYNRAATLHRVYESLQAQTYPHFEWIIVDDGSVDGTASLVDKWCKEARFPIRYYWQANQGKHIAFNLAVREARGDLFLNLDSDDSCVPNALERFVSRWESISPEERDQFVGVTCLCMDEKGQLVGSRFVRDPLDSDSIEVFYRYHARGEKWGFQRTEVLRAFPFPEEIKNTLVPESFVWDAIARHYKTRFVNEVLRTYWTEGQSLTRGQNTARFALMRARWHQKALNEHLNYFHLSPLTFLKSAVVYSLCSFHCGLGAREQFRQLRSLGARCLWAIVAPAGFLIYLIDRVRSGHEHHKEMAARAKEA